MTVNSNTIYGIYLDGNSNNVTNAIINSHSGTGDAGLFIDDDSSTINNVTLSGNYYGIYLDDTAGNNTIVNSTIENSTTYGIYMNSSANNSIYNNLFNNSNNTFFNGTVNVNYWNTTQQAGIRVYSSGTDIGGNYWTNSSGTGFSDTCVEINGFCNSAYNVTTGTSCTPGVDCGNNTDYLALTNDTISPTITIDSPTNITFGTGYIDYNITLDESLDFVYYSLDGGINLTMDNDSNTHYFNISTNHPILSDGFHNITFWINDTSGNANESTVFFTVDVAPTIELLSPDDNNSTTDRTPTFTYNGTDPNGDTLHFNINITATGGLCTDSIKEVNHTEENFTPSDDLKCFYDNGDYYLWTVQACENATAELLCSPWSDSRTINITAYLVINLTSDIINFGNMIILESKNTTNASLNPFNIENVGNARVNISINATQLWTSISASASEFFRSKVTNFSGNASGANTTFFNIPISSSASRIITELNYSTLVNSLDVDILLKVPSNEVGGNKLSTVEFTAILAE